MTANLSSDASARAARGQLTVRLSASPCEDGARGLQSLGLGHSRDGALYVPASYTPAEAAPLALCLHGAGGAGKHRIELWPAEADRAGVILLAPDSRGRTWDVLLRGYGPDIIFLSRALEHISQRYALNFARIAVEGFSDGASYALSLGVANGDLFEAVIANSPGFMHPLVRSGLARFYVDHGTEDTVLPIDYCSRLLVPQLRRVGYDVTYEEFEGGHRLPPPLARRSFDWWLQPGKPRP